MPGKRCNFQTTLNSPWGRGMEYKLKTLIISAQMVILAAHHTSNISLGREKFPHILFNVLIAQPCPPVRPRWSLKRDSPQHNIDEHGETCLL